MRLSEFGSNLYSQFGEDGMIAKIFELIGERSRVCVEFGASDGLSCSNTRRLLEAGWTSVLIEASLLRFETMSEQDDAGTVHRVNAKVTPTGPDSIDAILGRLGVEEVDFMSIDVDGMDYVIWEHMRIRPRVICIEYNQSIPPPVEVHQTEERDQVGASASALESLARSKGYFLVGLTKGNLFFTLEDESLKEFRESLDHLFRWEDLAYLATDYTGRPFMVGSPPWGLAQRPYVGPLGDGASHLKEPGALLASILDRYGTPVEFISTDWDVSPAYETDIGVAAFRKLFKDKGRKTVVIDASNMDFSDPDMGKWVVNIASCYGYTMSMVSTYMVFAR